MIKKIIKRVLFNLYLFKKIDWINLFRLYDNKSKNIVLICSPFPKSFFRWMLSGSFENDFALLQSLISEKINFKICIGAKKLLKYHKKNIFLNLSNFFTFQQGKNYSDSLLNFQEKLTLKGNILFPSISETKLWENKIYMHKKFEELNISSPKTYCINESNPPPDATIIIFPVLFKPAHSAGSNGIIKINNDEEYNKVINNTEHKEYLIQQWIDMHSDLRLIYIGDELVLHYWRINSNSAWQPTSTGRGSLVDFDFLPNQWMDFIFNEYKKLNIRTGAFDVTWMADDFNNVPLILEVSPSYMPNPFPSGSFKTRPYNEFKKNIYGEDAYYKKYMDLVFTLKRKLLKVYLNP